MSDNASPNRRWRRRGLQMLLLLVLVGAAITAWCIYEGISTSIHAEMALHATNEACDLTTEYVQMHDGAWPRCWHDLEQLDLPPNKYNVFPWPEDSQRLQQFVTIDFAADPNQLAKQTVNEFEAIKPVGPYYPYKQNGFVSALLEALRTSRRATPTR